MLERRPCTPVFITARTNVCVYPTGGHRVSQGAGVCGNYLFSIEPLYIPKAQFLSPLAFVMLSVVFVGHV